MLYLALAPQGRFCSRLCCKLSSKHKRLRLLLCIDRSERSSRPRERGGACSKEAPEVLAPFLCPHNVCRSYYTRFKLKSGKRERDIDGRGSSRMMRFSLGAATCCCCCCWSLLLLGAVALPDRWDCTGECLPGMHVGIMPCSGSLGK